MPHPWEFLRIWRTRVLVLFREKYIDINLCLAKLLLLLFCLVKKEAKKTTTHIKFQFGISHRPALHRRQKEIFTHAWTQRARLAFKNSCGMEII